MLITIAVSMLIFSGFAFLAAITSKRQETAMFIATIGYILQWLAILIALVK